MDLHPLKAEWKLTSWSRWEEIFLGRESSMGNRDLGQEAEWKGQEMCKYGSGES